MKKISLVVLLAVLVGGLTSGARAQIPGGRGQGPFVQGVLLTFQVVEADGFEDVDPEIADIVEELRKVFRFDGYRLLDTSVMRADLSADPPRRDGEPVFTRARQRVGVFQIDAWIYSTASPDAVRVSVALRDTSGEYINGGQRLPGPAIIDASVTVRSGQTVVLGSGRPSGFENALILVMSMD